MRDRKLLRSGLLILLITLLLLPAFADARMGGDDRILVWTAPVAKPGSQASNDPGELALLDNKGNLNRLMAVPEQANRIEACGQYAISPNGEHFAFIMGNDVSPRGVGLYMLTGDRLPEEIDTIPPLGCWGGGGYFRFSPDSEHFAYIAYGANAHIANFATGTLHYRKSSNYESEGSYDNAVAFDLTNEAIIFVTFQVNAAGQADEAVINRNDQELISLISAPNCQYTSASIQEGGDYYWAAISERCRSGTQWQLFRVERDGSNALLGTRQNPRGAMTPAAQVNTLIAALGGSHLFFTIPDGLANNSVGIYRVAANDLFAVDTLVENGGFVPILSGSRVAYPVMSPDRKWMAFATNTPVAANAVVVLNLENPGEAPITNMDFAADDLVSFMQFTPDSRHLIYIVGGDNGDDNSIFSLEVESGKVERLARGTYSGWGQLSPNSEELAVLAWVDNPDVPQRNREYLDLVLVNLDNGETETLFEGVVQGDTITNRFAVPMLWLR